VGKRGGTAGGTGGRVARVRLDRLLVDRGLAGSRERARALIMAGRVTLDGRPSGKGGALVPGDAAVAVTGAEHPYVGRGGLKLAGALEAFGIDPAGWTALDVGASTGGFTDCLLRRGAARVYALDVGEGQLDWSLRRDPRVVVMEGINARHLEERDLPERVDLAVVDVSFISLRLVLPALTPHLKPAAEVLALVKPQFEVGRGRVGRGGIVRDPRLHLEALRAAARAAESAGLSVCGACASPITGMEGNREFFLRLAAARPGLGAAERERLLGGIAHAEAAVED
jgi:23S rRNA (cytidine1920-2'-O)/16S rRNA (cytidine1409-2'-O)-methyltransferase